MIILGWAVPPGLLPLLSHPRPRESEDQDRGGRTGQTDLARCALGLVELTSSLVPAEKHLRYRAAHTRCLSLKITCDI